MNENLRNKIVEKAWNLIQEDLKIKKIYFFPWLISIIFLSLILVYQTVYTYVILLDKKEAALVILLDFFHSKYLIEILIWFWIFIILYLVLTPIFESWLIYYIDKKEKWEHISASDIIWWWLYKFLPMFEYSNIFSEFRFMSVVNIYLFCLRFIWVNYMMHLSYLFLGLLFLSMLINIVTAYSKFEIVLNNKKALESVSTSMKIALFNIWTTVRIYFFLFVVNVRIIINFFVFLLFPIIIVSAITYITSKIFLAIAVTILSVIFLWLIIILWYLWWVFEIFKTSVRYYAYIEWKKKVKDDHHDDHWHWHDDHSGWHHDSHWHDSHSWKNDHWNSHDSHKSHDEHWLDEHWNAKDSHAHWSHQKDEHSNNSHWWHH